MLSMLSFAKYVTKDLARSLGREEGGDGYLTYSGDSTNKFLAARAAAWSALPGRYSCLKTGVLVQVTRTVYIFPL